VADAPRTLAFLRDPRSYPDRSRRVELIETHFAWVFLSRTLACKLKKPLRQGSMDYRTLARRRRGCDEEVRLNRRLAPGVYLGAWALCEDRHGRLRLRRGGRVRDWLVVMRRLSATRTLDRAMARGRVSASDVARVSATLAAFFGRARPARMSRRLRLQRLRRQGANDAAQLAKVHRAWRPGLRRLLALQRCFRARRRVQLAARAARVVEGHGDLRPEHVFLGPPVTVIDCLEFDRRLRLRDPAEELAYLRLELRRLGHARRGRQLCANVLQRLGDTPGEALLSYYMSLQALTRAKLAAWHVGDPQFPDPRPWLRRATSYLRDARHHAERALRLADSEDASDLGRRRPALQQRRQRSAVAHARHGLRQQRGNVQYRHAR
jgi:aminoglycoside phosphotransferase family enzyme